MIENWVARTRAILVHNGHSMEYAKSLSIEDLRDQQSLLDLGLVGNHAIYETQYWLFVLLHNLGESVRGLFQKKKQPKDAPPLRDLNFPIWTARQDMTLEEADMAARREVVLAFEKEQERSAKERKKVANKGKGKRGKANGG